MSDMQRSSAHRVCPACKQENPTGETCHNIECGKFGQPTVECTCLDGKHAMVFGPAGNGKQGDAAAS